ncbi:hypothetical protein [Streptomyces cavernae]|nr:hypothetical protein [Streptomyces cavernae]
MNLHELVAEAIADAYFRKEAGGRAGVHVEFKDVERLDIHSAARNSWLL